MVKYLVTLEYRYHDEPNSFNSTYRTKIDTIGIFEDIKDAVKAGNNTLIEWEKIFNLNKCHNKKDRLTETKKLVSNLAYLETPFNFYLNIETLNFKNSLTEVLKSIENYNKYKENLEWK